MQAALQGLADHLARSKTFRDVYVLLFQHGVPSTGAAPPEAWAETVRAHGAVPHLLALDRSCHPHDIGILGRYACAFEQPPRARQPWSPLAVDAAVSGLARAIDVTAF